MLIAFLLFAFLTIFPEIKKMLQIHSFDDHNIKQFDPWHQKVLTSALLTCNYVVKKSGGHAEDPNQEVAHSKVQDEQVGDGPHVFAPQHDEAHHSISYHAHEEDQEVGHDEDGCSGLLMQVKSDIGDVAPGYDGLLR